MTKNENEVIQSLYDLGHFNNPAHPTGVTLTDLPGLRLTDHAVRTAIASYQEFMAADFDRLALKHHGRIGNADGDVGPATSELFEVERCGLPDYDGAEPATGRGSWPAGCLDDWPHTHTFTVNVDKSGMPSYLGDRDDPNSIFEQAWALQRAAYADMGILFIRQDGGRANTKVTWTRGRGWIGLAIVPNNQSCDLSIWAKFDNRYAPRDMLNQWARLLCHEFGHNMGMSHSRGGVMNPSITSGKFSETEWRGDPSESILTRYFGGEPVDLKDGPEPDDPKHPPPDPKEHWFRGSFELMQGQESLGEYILTPKPRV